MRKLHPSVRAYLLRRPWRQVLVDQLVVTAESLDWNLSAVAQKLKVARYTLYLRLRAARQMHLVPRPGTGRRTWDRKPVGASRRSRARRRGRR